MLFFTIRKDYFRMLERPFFSRAISTSSVRPQSVRPRLHEQIQPSLVAQILDPYEVTPDKFEQIKYVLFAHVNKALAKKC